MKLRKLAAPIIVTLGMMTPLKTVQHAPITPICDTFERTCQVDNLTKAYELAKTFEQKNDTNFVGGITRTFSKENIEKLKELIKKQYMAYYDVDATKGIGENNTYITTQS